jgi:hypothetical protein
LALISCSYSWQSAVYFPSRFFTGNGLTDLMIRLFRTRFLGRRLPPAAGAAGVNCVFLLGGLDRQGLFPAILNRLDVYVSVNQKIIAASAMLADRREPQ